MSNNYTAKELFSDWYSSGVKGENGADIKEMRKHELECAVECALANGL